MSDQEEKEITKNWGGRRSAECCMGKRDRTCEDRRERVRMNMGAPLKRRRGGEAEACCQGSRHRIRNTIAEVTQPQLFAYVSYTL